MIIMEIEQEGKKWSQLLQDLAQLRTFVNKLMYLRVSYKERISIPAEQVSA
jgi:hypothetical protein